MKKPRHNPNSPLSEQQLRFCHEYLIDYDGTAAAKRAMYADKSAHVTASHLLKHPPVIAKMAELRKAQEQRCELRSDTILKELLLIATADIAQAYNKETGELLPIHDIPEATRRAMAGIDVFEEFEGTGRERMKIGETVKVKFWDKPRALELLGKHLKLWTDRVEVTNGDLANELQKARERVKKGK